MTNPAKTRRCGPSPCHLVLVLATALAACALATGATPPGLWRDEVLAFPYTKEAPPGPLLQLLQQDFEQLERNQSVLKTPLTIGTRRFPFGIGTHATSRLRVISPEPIVHFSAWVGVDNNERTAGTRGSVVFLVSPEGQEVFRSPVMRGGQGPVLVDVDTQGATPAAGRPQRGTRTLDLQVTDAADGPGWDHADWAEATLTLQSGTKLRLDELHDAPPPYPGKRYPFSFTYDRQPSDTLLPSWQYDGGGTNAPGGVRTLWRTWTDGATGLRVRWEGQSHPGYDDCEWLLDFENTGSSDTPILEGIQALDLTRGAPLEAGTLYRLHRTKGVPANPSDLEPAIVTINDREEQHLSAGGGRSSNRDFPFFKLETGEGSWIVAVGWSGQWAARVCSPDGHHLRVTAGMEKTHFTLHPGEKVRTPRILLLFHKGDTLECNALFRQLLYQYYAAKPAGRPALPTLFCNTCFTRGGGWLNECNAANQISLIRAYAPLGLEALITDAGWFEGGWPAGAGNWTPRKEAYPQGMGPVAAAARQHGMVYGLWFEPERVVAGTQFQRSHPDWALTDGTLGQTTLLANFGLREVQDHFFKIVSEFMKLPGFGFYRQDFNMDPLSYWRHADAPDRQGITEIRYVEGLYSYWDHLAAAWPDSLREECASGGRRIDLETLRRMPLHQKSDYWFDNEVDQASLWSLSQYLPNNLITVPLTRLDDCSFHSTLASSLIPAWIADAPDFDAARARKLLDRYREIRHLLVGAWYPLLPYSRSPKDWLAMQFHRPDLNQGLLLVFRRADNPYRTLEVSLHGLQAETIYEIASDRTHDQRQVKGAELMRDFPITIVDRHRSELLVYRQAGRPSSRPAASKPPP